MRDRQKQQVHSATSELIKALNNFKTHKTVSQNQTMQEQQKYFSQKILTHHLHKIDIQCLNLFEYLQDHGLDPVKDVIEILLSIVSDNKMLSKQDENYQPVQNYGIGAVRSEDYCLGCGRSVEKNNIVKIMENMGITYGQIQSQQKVDMEKIEKIPIKQQLSDDGLLEKLALHVANIDSHLIDLMKVIQRDIMGKTHIFLSKDSEQLSSKQFNFDQHKQILLKNEQQIRQIEQSKQKLTDNFMDKLRIPIYDSVVKMLKNIEERRLKNLKELQREQSCQTTFNKQAQLIACLEERISELNREIFRLKSGKAQDDKQIIRRIETESKLRLQINKLLTEKQVYQQKLSKQKSCTNLNEIKYLNELNLKTKQIEELQKMMAEQKQRRNSVNSKSSVGTNRQKRSSYISVQKQSSSNLKPISRPSVDFSLHQDELMDIVNFSRFNQEKKAIGNRRSSKFWGKSIKAIVRPDISRIETSQTMQTQPQELKIDKLNRFEIVKQVDMKIEETKSDGSEEMNLGKLKISQNRMKSKKLKALRQFKSQKQNQNNLTASTYFRQNSGFSYDYDESSQQNIKPINSKKRLKTETHDALPQYTKSIERLRSGFMTGSSKLRQRQKQYRDQKPIRDILNSPAITAESLTLFGGESVALDYQRNTGIWPQINITDKLAIDFENTAYCSSIQRYFKYLQENYPQIYNEYATFLVYPFQVIVFKSKNQPYTHLELPETPNKIKQIFLKLIRYHKMVHKNCSHITEFLSQIGYTQI